MPATKKNAYLTVYLALTMAVMLSLCLALIEGVRSSAVYMEAECVVDIGLNSIFAEYHRELLKQYNLFAIDSSYGTTSVGVGNTERHLTDYVEKNLTREDVALDWLLYRDFLGMSLRSADIKKVSLLTDGKGAVFRKRAAEAVKDDVGLNLYRELSDWMRVVEVNQLAERDIAAEKRELDRELAAYNGRKVKVADEEWETVDGVEIKVSDEEWKTVEVKNPTEVLEQKRREGILKHVVDDVGKLSSRSVRTDNLVSARIYAGAIQKGNIKVAEASGEAQLLERFFFQEYLLRYMGNYRKQSGEDALRYQIEYLIAGKGNDTDNLRSTADTLCAIREVSNVSYLMADQGKRSAAKLLAGALASLMMLPEATDVLEIILLFGWSYAESLHDVKSLLAGGRVPLTKDAETWHYGLEAALDFGSKKESIQRTGLSYEDYLRILMMLKNKDTLTLRAMDMVEVDIRQTPGNGAFRLDGCIDCAEASIKIDSSHGYDCEIARRKGYSTQ